MLADENRIPVISPLMHLQDVSFRYETAEILKQVHFRLYPKERVALTGANGSGKSTLLHLLVGLLIPTAGTLQIFGQECCAEKDFIPIRGRVGLLFQDADDQLFCPTVADDLAFGPLNQGKSLTEVKAIIEDTLELLGLTGYQQRITYRLSGGEKRLVALATVLAMQPEILLLDEPTNGLDEEFQQRITNLLLQLPQAMLIVSHDREFLDKVSHRQVFLKKGRLYDAHLESRPSKVLK